MFGRKSSEIQSLTAQLETANEDLGRMSSVFHEIENYVPLARDLRASVTRRLGNLPVDGMMGPDINEVYDQAYADIADALIKRALSSMTPTEFAVLYAQKSGDAAIREKLEEQAALRTQDFERKQKLARLRQEIAQTGTLNLTCLDEGEVLTVGLFPNAKANNAYKKTDINSSTVKDSYDMNRKIVMRVRDPERGEVQFLSDHRVYISTSGYGIFSEQKFVRSEIPDHAVGVVGTGSTGDAGYNIVPAITVRSSLAFALKGQDIQTTKQIVGFVETHDNELLLNGRK